MRPNANAGRSVSRPRDVVRLLFDEQLSEALCDQLHDLFPNSVHVRALAGASVPEQRVWNLAIEYGCLLVTKDEDFHRLSVLRGAPPKVVWIRLGNCATSDIAQLLRHHRDAIQAFEAQAEATFLSLG